MKELICSGHVPNADISSFTESLDPWISGESLIQRPCFCRNKIMIKSKLSAPNRLDVYLRELAIISLQILRSCNDECAVGFTISVAEEQNSALAQVLEHLVS